MGKLLLIVLALLVVYWVLKSYKKKVERRSKAPGVKEEEDMVRCAQCGVHLPRSESLTTAERFYCSADHARAHDKAD